MMHPNEETLLRYRFETLDEVASKEVAEHLRTCSSCAAQFALIGSSIERLNAYDAEKELDPALAAHALAQVKARAQPEHSKAEPAQPEDADDAPRAPIGVLAWLGFAPGARLRGLRRAAVLLLVGCGALLGAGQTVVAMREVRTDTRVSGEKTLLAGGRSYVQIDVLSTKNREAIEAADVSVVLTAASGRFPMFEGKTDARGRVLAALDVPNQALEAAVLEVTTSARGEQDVVRQPVVVGHDFKVHLSTDKPLYQPGQAIHVRALALESPALLPAKDREVVFEVFDPKNNRLAGKTIKSSSFGIAAWDVELASELALGDYRVSVQVGGNRTEVPVKVARYTLPKFKLTVVGPTQAVLAGETLRTTLSAKYFFGKPVAGAQVHAVLQREDGSLVGDELNAVTDQSGELTLPFELPSTLAAPGQPESLTLLLEVKDAAGQQEQKSQRFTVARELLAIEVVVDQGGITEGLPTTLYFLTTTPDGAPEPCDVSATLSTGADLSLRTGENGVGVVQLPSLENANGFWLEAFVTGRDGQRASRKLFVPRRAADFNVDTDRALYRPGDAIDVAVTARAGAGDALIRVYKEGRVIHSQPLSLEKNRGKTTLRLPSELTGSLELDVTHSGSKTAVTRRVIVAAPGGLAVKMTADQATHRPGATGKLRFEVKDSQGKPKAAALGLTVVDESLWALTATKPAQARAFFLLDRALQSPRGQLAAADLLAGRSFSDGDQLAARVLLAIAAGAHAAGFTQETLTDEKAVLQQQRQAWDRFASPALNVLLAALALLGLVAMIRFAAGWLVPLVFLVATPVAIAFTNYRHQGDVFWVCLAAYVIAGVAQSVSRKSFAWGYFAMPVIALVLVVTLFGDNIRGLFAMSADSLAGADQMAMVGPRFKSMKNFAAEERYEGDFDKMEEPTPPGKGDGEPPRRDVRVRQHFPETMYVNPQLITDESGVATLELPFADSITDWRLSALASTMDGQLGTMDAPLRAFQDFFVDLDVPVALVRGDSATVPIAVHNYLTTEQTIRLEVKAEPWFQVVGPASFTLKLAGGGVGGQDVRIKVLKPGHHTLTAQADGTALSDAVARPVWVTEAGQLKTQAVSGTLKANETTRVAITIPEGAVPGSTSLMLKVFPSKLASALDGLEGSLKAPHGCFEQTSSTTYPNVLVWNYLQRTGKKNPAAEERARSFVALGYQRLLTFEVPGGGFEWFGRAPANQVLTAYGLMEFKDMSRVYPIDEKLIQRTQDFLVSKQQNDGSWLPDQSSLSDGLWKSGFDGRVMVTAYVTWALVESGYEGRALSPALRYLVGNLDQVNDAYTLSMIAATLARANDPGAPVVVKKLVTLAKREKELAWFVPADATLYYSRGIGGTIESTALAAYALMVGKQEPELVRALLGYLAANRDASGAWHSTQGSVLALRALLFATGGQTQDLELAVKVNGAEAGKLRLSASADAPARSDLTAVKPGLNVVELTGASDADFQVVAVYTQAWREKGGEAEEVLGLKVDFGRRKTELGGIVPVDMQVIYRGTDASGMVVVSLGLPAGLAALPEDLQALVATKAVARFEVGPNAVTLYLDRLDSKVAQKLSLRLKATAKVDTQGVGSATFLYYHPAVRAVVAAIPIQVN